MAASILGIHHVTAICGDAQQNLDFYTGVLGLRLVKLTVNFDDPATYHLYYGDAMGSPGSILTFFPYPLGHQGRHGTGQAVSVALAIPPGSSDFWKRQLESEDVDVRPAGPGEEASFRFEDPDGLALAMVETEAVGNPWPRSGIPADVAIQGIQSVTLSEEGLNRTARLLTETLGFRLVREREGHSRFQIGQSVLDVLCQPDAPTGRGGRGTVHHVAFRTADDPQQEEWRAKLADEGLNVSPVMDRQYFHSIYFREPGGVLFEIATDAPGFAVDEPEGALGTSLKLPPAYEGARAQIEGLVTPLILPDNAKP